MSVGLCVTSPPTLCPAASPPISYVWWDVWCWVVGDIIGNIYSKLVSSYACNFEKNSTKVVRWGETSILV